MCGFIIECVAWSVEAGLEDLVGLVGLRKRLEIAVVMLWLPVLNPYIQ